MENASKALIIAGAILLAILLISLGIMIFTQAQDTVNNNGMSQADIQAFNNKFIKYEGTNKSGSEVKALINEAIALNAGDSNLKLDSLKITNIKLYEYGKDSWNELNTSGIDINAKYNVELVYDTGTGNDTGTGKAKRVNITKNT